MLAKACTRRSLFVALSSLHALASCTRYAARVRTSFSLRYTRAHDALSSLHAGACCTVFATRVHVHYTCAHMHCPGYTRVHLVLSTLQARAVSVRDFHCFAALKTPTSPSHSSALGINQKLEILVLFMPKNVFLPSGLQTYFVFLFRGDFPLYTQFPGQQFECFDKHVLSLSF